ncbi:MAG TPA: 2,3-bisphosphoglycerate-independent phosphoglycerate mutase [Thermoanaerobaculia bacterium]
MVQPIVLVICDGWGVAPPSAGNAITRARTPVFDRWLRDYSSTTLLASGEAVGLPAGMMGNSEVGHLNLGAGRMVPQDLLRIDLALRDGSFFENPTLIDAMEKARRPDAALHVLGLLSDGGVHSHERHLWGLLEMARRRQVSQVFVHAFTDGRDTPPRSAQTYVERLEGKLRETGGRIATVSGRYFAMDRDLHWDRTAEAHRAVAAGRGLTAPSAGAAVAAAYERGEGDEFIRPTAIVERPIRDGDAAIFFNFRADRARQMTRALTEEEFSEFERGPAPRLHFVCFTEYKKEFPLAVAFPQRALEHILAEVWAEHGVRNLRVAETEKYAHVTYFFNGGVERSFPGEERTLIASWRGATYDLHPQMKASEIAESVEKALRGRSFGAVVVNFANADMVGHTGKLPETIQGIEVLDRCLGRVEASARDAGAILMMTADHGNAEQMTDPVTGQPHTAHTTNPVPLVIGGAGSSLRLASGGSLADVAPTLLRLQGLAAPAEMTGRDLSART